MIDQIYQLKDKIAEMNAEIDKLNPNALNSRQILIPIRLDYELKLNKLEKEIRLKTYFEDCSEIELVVGEENE